MFLNEMKALKNKTRNLQDYLTVCNLAAMVECNNTFGQVPVPEDKSDVLFFNQVFPFDAIVYYLLDFRGKYKHIYSTSYVKGKERGASSRWGVDGTPPQGGVQEASDIDVQATSAGSSRHGGAMALLWAPPG